MCLLDTRPDGAMNLADTQHMPLALAQNLRLAVGTDDLIDPQITHRLTLMDIGIIDLNFIVYAPFFDLLTQNQSLCT